MSFSLDVIPAEQEPVSFAAFKKYWLATLADIPEIALAEDIGLYARRPENELKDDDLLDIGARFSFNHSANRALTLSLLGLAESYIGDEAKYLDFYAPNDLEVGEIAILAEKWRQAGYYFKLTSYGHYEKEKALMCVIAIVLAKCTEGRVLVTAGSVFYRTGIFTPAKFRENMRFIKNMG